MVDQRPETRIVYGLLERFQFLFHAFGDELDSTVRKIANTACNFEASHEGFYGVAKTDTLDTPRIKDTHPAAAHTTQR